MAGSAGRAPAANPMRWLLWKSSCATVISRQIIHWLFIRKWRDSVVPHGRRIACSFALEKIKSLYDWRHGACNERWGR